MVVAREPKRGTYLPAPAGMHSAVCADVIDLGFIENTFKPGQMRHYVRLCWFIDEELPADKRGADGVPYFMVSQRFNLSLHEKAALRKLLTTWRGRPFTKEELKGFDLENVIGAAGQIVVVHNQKDDTTYANVEAVVPLARGMEKMAIPEGYIRAKDRPDWVEPKPPPVTEDTYTEDTYEDSYFENNGADDDSSLPF